MRKALMVMFVGFSLSLPCITPAAEQPAADRAKDRTEDIQKKANASEKAPMSVTGTNQSAHPQPGTTPSNASTSSNAPLKFKPKKE